MVGRKKPKGKKMKKMLLLALVVSGSMFARKDSSCTSCHSVCKTVYEAARPVCKELRLVTVPAQREVYYSCPEPTEAHTKAVSGFYDDRDTINVSGNVNTINA